MESGLQEAGFQTFMIHSTIKLLQDVGIDQFTLNRFLPIPILTDFENFNLTDTDTDFQN